MTRKPTKISRNFIAGALLASAATLTAINASADFVHSDDVIIDGSACVGFDCVNGESFGFDTIRLKENNLRIKFQDTSTSASFPSNDWQIAVNDTSNGGGNRFSIEDVDSGRTPFSIEAAAPAHALYVDDGGRIGLGTSTPVVEVHVVDGDTPTLRLEQNGSSGFTPQTWDVAGNETNFFVRDATNGSKLPLRIRPSAPSNSIFVDTDGDVGLGTSSPRGPIDVLAGGGSGDFAANSNDVLILQNDGPARLAMVNTTTAGEKIWTINSNNTLRFSGGTDSSEFEVQTNGNLNVGGACIEFNAQNAASRFACTFSAGAAPACASAPSSCP